MSGHTQSAEYGQDVLCAGISAVSQSTCLGILEVLGVKADFKKDEKKGLLQLDLSKCSHEDIDKSQVLLQTMLKSLQDISIGNEKYMKVEVYDEVY